MSSLNKMNIFGNDEENAKEKSKDREEIKIQRKPSSLRRVKPPSQDQRQSNVKPRTETVKPKIKVRGVKAKGETQQSKTETLFSKVKDKVHNNKKQSTINKDPVKYQFVDDTQTVIAQMDSGEIDKDTLLFKVGYNSKKSKFPLRIVINGKGVALTRNAVTHKIIKTNSFVSRRRRMKYYETMELEKISDGNSVTLYKAICQYKTSPMKVIGRKKFVREVAIYTEGYIVFASVEDLLEGLELKVFAVYDIDVDKMLALRPSTEPVFRKLSYNCKVILGRYNKKKKFNSCEIITDKLNKEDRGDFTE